MSATKQKQNSRGGSVRLQIDLSPERREQLRRLEDDTRSETLKQLFGEMMLVLQWIVDETRDGRVIAALDPEDGRYKELVTPAIQAVKAGSAGRKSGPRLVATKKR